MSGHSAGRVESARALPHCTHARAHEERQPGRERCWRMSWDAKARQSMGPGPGATGVVMHETRKEEMRAPNRAPGSGGHTRVCKISRKWRDGIWWRTERGEGSEREHIQDDSRVSESRPGEGVVPMCWNLGLDLMSLKGLGDFHGRCHVRDRNVMVTKATATDELL